MIVELPEGQFKATFIGKMTNVTESAEPLDDFWIYVKALTKEYPVLKYALDNKLVKSVYRNETNTYDHVLLPMDNKNIFLVIVVNLVSENIFGHYLLDLESEYGLKK